MPMYTTYWIILFLVWPLKFNLLLLLSVPMNHWFFSTPRSPMNNWFCVHVFGLDRKQDRVDVLGLWIENDSLKKKKKSKPVETCYANVYIDVLGLWIEIDSLKKKRKIKTEKEERVSLKGLVSHALNPFGFEVWQEGLTKWHLPSFIATKSMRQLQ